MVENFAEITKILYDIEGSFFKLEFFFLILMVLSILFFFAEGIIPKLILASLYGICFSFEYPTACAMPESGIPETKSTSALSVVRQYFISWFRGIAWYNILCG